MQEVANSNTTGMHTTTLLLERTDLARPLTGASQRGEHELIFTGLWGSRSMFRKGEF